MVDQIILSLDEDKRVYAPGDQLSGRLEVRFEEDCKVRRFELAVGWRTEGRGDEDSRTAEVVELTESGSTVPKKFEHYFNIVLPEAPWSYAGNLIKIQWFVGCYVKVGLKSEQRKEVEFDLLPNASESTTT